MKKVKFLIFCSLFSMFIMVTTATSGALKSSSIKTCNGKTYGSHTDHWHVASYKSGRYYATGSAINSDPCKKNNNENSSISNSKSSDNKLKKIIIDDIEYSDVNNVTHITTNETVEIEAETSDIYAEYYVGNTKSLEIGENKIVISVEAENGSIKKYTVLVIREKILSSETGIKAYINGKILEFQDYKTRYEISNDVENISFSYELADEKAQAEVEKPNTLKEGSNLIKILVTAENGQKQIYEIEVYKNSKDESGIGYILICAGLGCGGYYIYKKKNK